MNVFDPALATLFLPFDELLAGRAAALFLRARDGVESRLHIGQLICEQTFKPDADALTRAGFAVNAEADRKYPLVLLLPPRQREEARALFAHATQRVEPQGYIVASAANDEGARSHERDLATLAGSVASLSKNKCRVFWAKVSDASLNRAVLDAWRDLDAPRAICNGRFTSRPGIFAWDRIDVASELLAKHLPSDLAGRAADLGAGWGFLTHELLQRAPRIESVDLYEAELRALDLARVNLRAHAQLGFHWHDVTQGLPRKYDVIVTNPPFHQGASERTDIGKRFIAVAAQALVNGGRLWLVANRHLPYESVLDLHFGTLRIVAQERGFKIIEAVRRA